MQMINYTEDEKEYLREYLEQEQGITEDQWQDVELMQHYVSMCYDIDIQSMQYTGYPEESVKTSLSYIVPVVRRMQWLSCLPRPMRPRN